MSIGGRGTLASPWPLKTVGRYWPFAPTVFDYTRRAMPLTAPQSLSDREVYGLIAYLLWRNGVISATQRLDRTSLSRVRMPNREGFVTLAPRGFDGNIDGAGSPKQRKYRP